MSADPIMIPCEGTDCAGYGLYYLPEGVVTMCPMCGEYRLIDTNGLLLPHERTDILAMVARGDFG